MGPNTGLGLSQGGLGELKRKIYSLYWIAIIIYRIGAHIPVPGINPEKLAEFFRGEQGGILGMFNMFSGGALQRFTVFALNVMPYISASIIIQLFSGCFS